MLKTLLVIISVTTLLRWQSWFIPLNRDEGGYAYTASHLADSDFVLYRDAFEHKPPGIFFLYRPFIAIFSSGLFPIRLLGWTNAVVSALVTYFLLRRFRIATSTSLLFTLCFVVLTNTFFADGLTSNTEMFMTTFLGLSLLSLLSGRPLTAGITAAASILIKPVALFYLPILFLFSPKRLHLLIGFLLPFIVTVSWLVTIGAWDKYWESVISYNLFYVQNGLNTSSNLLWAPKFIWLFLVSSLVSLFFSPRRSPLLILWLIASIASAKILTRPVDHYYFPVLQAVVLLLATLTIKWPFFAGLGLFTFWLVPILFSRPYQAFLQIYGSAIRYPYEAARLAGVIKNRTRSEDEIFLWVDEPQILYLSGRRSTSRFMNTYAFTLPGALAEHIQSLSRQPAVIVNYESPPPAWLAEFLTSHSYSRTTEYNFAQVYWRQ